MRRLLKTLGLATVTALVLAGCTVAQPNEQDGLPNDASTLRVLAGSEVKDMAPILESAAADKGIRVVFDYTGTLAGTELVASGRAAGRYDATWFPNNRYLSLLPGAAKAVSSSVKIMSSPVVLGLRPEVATRLGWDSTPPTWADLAAAAAGGEFTYGMTNPAASNSGFSALVAVATALSGTGTALTDADVTAVSPELTRFFSGQKLTAGSSGFLADKFVADPTLVDGVINYESVLLGLADKGAPLTIVRPTDGVVTSDYPLTLLASADTGKRPLFDTLTAWLTTDAVQRRIVSETHRRPGVPGIDTGSAFPAGILFETPFPNTLEVANTLIGTYLDTVRAPAQTLFVLDTSGSMAGERLTALQQALKNLAGADSSTTGGFAAFRNRERVTLIPFSTAPDTPTIVDVPQADKTEALQRIRDVADGLSADGGTAIYASLERAYALARQQKAERPDTFVSIVLMTDGENTDGPTSKDFAAYYTAQGEDTRSIATYVVLFGNGNVDELTSVAKLTGGQAFDALNGDLSSAFQDIRGYQ
ncbi:vWA domain-containing protein [Cryobacterium zhongshanensis]|uniref:VWA domain-containing protein n=1 Tax=Cryobacterium zhongshanensis TaxID=2928153 RepID=A0AA41UER6_9MICO|nr:VWA domain-containing protein [Cryobacterium zhongshanensis]MCI4657728.1 VWA domain-containing protein [Cryobacterium zhongshanensis]